MPRKKRRTKKLPAMVDPALLSIKQVPADIINAEKVTERLTNTKLNAKRKLSTKIKAAIKNYQNAVTRKKRADTESMKHYFAIESNLYTLTECKHQKWMELYPELDSENDDFENALGWIQEHGKHIDTVTVYNY